MVAGPSRIRTRGGSSPSEHAGGLCSVTSIFRQACDGSTFVRRLLQDVRPPSATPTCARLPRSLVTLRRSVIERVLTAAAVILGSRCDRSRRVVGVQQSPRCGSSPTTVITQPAPSASSTHALSDRVIGPEALPLPASASFAQPAWRGWRALVDNRGGRRHCVQDSPPMPSRFKPGRVLDAVPSGYGRSRARC